MNAALMEPEMVIAFGFASVVALCVFVLAIWIESLLLDR